MADETGDDGDALRPELAALRDRVDIAEAGMPDGVSSVTVEQIGTSNQPVYSFSLSGDYPPEVLRAFALTRLALKRWVSV